MKINNRHFEVLTKRNKEDFDYWVHRALAAEGQNLGDWYKNPSMIKRNIYNDWREWFCDTDMNLWHFGICSANAQAFSITIIDEDHNGKPVGVLFITRDHNRYITYKEQ